MKGKRKRRTRDQIVQSRVTNMYRYMRARLGPLPFTKDELIPLVQKALDAGVCMYCHQKLTASLFSIDHVIPVSRDGSLGLENLNAQVCRRCNLGKGRCTHDEYMAVMDVMWSLPDEARSHLIASLKTGAALRIGAANRGRRRKK